MKISCLVLCAGLVAIATVLPASTAEWRDWAPKKGVWRFESVKVDPDKIDDYVTALKKGGELAASEELKRLGVIDDFVVMIKLNPFGGDANVILGQHFTSYAALEPEVVLGPSMRKKLAAAVATKAPKDPREKAEIDSLLAGVHGSRSYTSDELWYAVDFEPPAPEK